MSDMGDDFRALREMQRKQREKNLAEADPSGWTQHTLWHWSRTLNGKRLDYWPSRKRFQYDGKMRAGDVNEFIRNMERQS